MKMILNRDKQTLPCCVRWACTALLLGMSVLLRAQEFTVQQFRPLPNDISAFVNPVKDLNDEACALLKIVGSPDFVFTTPLGIVQQRAEVGETWVYVPAGTIQLTIKHPRWGILRDYRFPAALEARLTYELVLQHEVPLPERVMPPLPEQATGPAVCALMPPLQLEDPAPRRIRRPREPWKRLVLADAGIGKDLTGGVRLVLMRHHGAFVHVMSNFRFSSASSGMECDRNGMPVDGSIPPYYTGRVEKSYYAVTAGGIHRLIGNWCVYEGVGYGSRTVMWETDEGAKVRNRDYSTKGITAEAGVLLRLRRWAVAAGAVTTNGSYWSFNVGAGVCF